ncbi:MAG: AmpG family muropeptide MFS transporter, partial [Candidatus Tectomicrobia bacterium]|nr:AmpG family muropeptide MFS transporter [Candidatus Tectomicrobia bacterium]
MVSERWRCCALSAARLPRIVTAKTADRRGQDVADAGGFRGIAQALSSWRTAAVTLLSFSSGLPLGLVLIAIPDWMRSIGVDIRVVGLFALTQAPWTFKVFWAPLLERYSPPWLGRRRGWTALMQVALLVTTLGLAGVGQHPQALWVVGALALAVACASATQDIAIDAYAVEVLQPHEQGIAVGARTAVYRAAMYISGGLSITLAGQYSWPLVNLLLALLYVPLLWVTWRAPVPQAPAAVVPSLRAAIWEPLREVFQRERAIEILAFVCLYKLADNLAGALLRPFLIDLGYSEFDRGVGLATIGLVTTLGGTFLGGLLTTLTGLGHALWIGGALQIVSNLGYIFLADSAPDRLLLTAAMAIENL